MHVARWLPQTADKKCEGGRDRTLLKRASEFADTTRSLRETNENDALKTKMTYQDPIIPMIEVDRVGR